MLIKRLEVKGFKSLRDVVWEPGPLTVLIGPNGSGKTNLLRALDLLQKFPTGNFSEWCRKSGGFNSLTWDGVSDKIDIRVLCQKNHSNFPDLEYCTTISDTQNGYYTIEFEQLRPLPSKHDLFMRTAGDTCYRKKDKLFPIQSKLINSAHSILASAKTLIFEHPITEAFIEFLASLQIYNTLSTSRDAAIRQPIVSRYHKKVDPDGQNLVNVLHTLYSENRDFEDDINTAMRAAFGDEFDRIVFPPAADQLIQLRIRWKSLKREQSMFDLSDGTIRFLFLMTVLCNPEPAPLIAIDEPETGLHPSMFPIIAEYAAEASKRTQVIFSTHSPQFLDAFNDFDVTTTVTAWKDGETKIKNLDGDTLKKWLEHYSIGSLFLSGDLEALA
ncbi:AAA family ATPase [Solidesulfovibrio sp.]